MSSKSSKELGPNAIYEDWKRKAVDDAKKRAVAQNVDYETFKNMVSVAHLKPLQAKTPSGTSQAVMLPSWGFSADGAVHLAEQQSAVGSGLNQDEPCTQPLSSGDFAREWRRGCVTSDARYRYLRLTTPEVLSSIFRVEIGTDQLREILVALDSSWLSFAGAAEDRQEGSGTEEAFFVIQCLEALSTVGRLSLTVRLLGSSGKSILESLFQSLHEALDACGSRSAADSYKLKDVNEETLQDIGIKFGVALSLPT